MHTSVVACRSAIRIAVALTLCVLLLPVQNVSIVVNPASAQGQNQSSDREGRPRLQNFVSVYCLCLTKIPQVFVSMR